MAKFKLMANAEIETATPEDVRKELGRYGAEQQAAQMARAQGKKYARLNPPVTGVASGGKLLMGGDYPNAGQGGVITQAQQPRAGFAWAMRRIAIGGLTTGTTPDTVNLFRHASDAAAYAAGPAALSAGDWQFNGNNFAYTFSFGELVFLEGETPILVSAGTFAATGLITMRADFVEVPQPLLFEALG